MERGSSALYRSSFLLRQRIKTCIMVVLSVKGNLPKNTEVVASSQ
jgi:hypothetical protein